MNIKQATALTGLVAATVGISLPAFAQDSGWYLGASVGASKTKDFCPNQIAVGASCDETSSAYGVFGGYQFNRYLGAELGYTDLGEAEAAVPGITETIKVRGVQALAVGAIPINPQFEVYGKVGAFLWDFKDKCEGASCTFSSLSETGSDLTYGLGAKFNFSKNAGMTVQYQRYQDVGKEATTGENDIDVYSVGIVFKFF